MCVASRKSSPHFPNIRAPDAHRIQFALLWHTELCWAKKGSAPMHPNKGNVGPMFTKPTFSEMAEGIKEKFPEVILKKKESSIHNGTNLE